MLYKEIIENIVAVMGTETVVFFVASGISVPDPTRAPSGMKLRNDIVEVFRNAVSPPELKDMVGKIASRLQEGTAGAPPLGFEEVCQVVSHVTQDYEGFVGCLDCILNGTVESPRQPNKIHRFLAHCLSFGHVVVTPNYDSMIEEAWYKQLGSGKRLRVCYDEGGFREVMEDIKRGETYGGALLKVHGTFHAYEYLETSAQFDKVRKYDSVVTTLERVGKGLPEAQVSVLQELLRRHSTVFMGYSASDIDIIYPIFARVLADEPSSKLIFWLQWDPNNRCTVVGKEELAEFRREQENVPPLNKKWESFNVATLLDNRNRHGAEERAWRIDADSVPFIGAFASGLRIKLDDWSQSNQSHQSQDVLSTWVAEKEPYQQLLVIAEFAGRVNLWDEQYQLSERALQIPDVPPRVQLMARKMASWATRTINRDESLRQSNVVLQLVDQIEWPDDIFKSIERSHLYSLRGLSFRMTNDIIQARNEMYRALGERPCYEVLCAWALECTRGAKPAETALLEAMRGFLIEDPRDELAEIFNRVANILYTSVRDPATESTSLGMLTVAEQARLKLAIQFARRALQITEETGNVRYRAQVLNILGPALAKLGSRRSVYEAKDLYEESQRVAGQLGWTRESAQHPRQMGIVYEAVAEAQPQGDERLLWLEKAVDAHEEAITNWRIYSDPKAVASDIRTATWHSGRLFIKLGQYESAAAKLRDAISLGGGWQAQVNAKAFLLVALTKGKKEIAPDGVGALSSECTDICSTYSEQLKTPERLKAMPYGCSNALANLQTVRHIAATTGIQPEPHPAELQHRICETCREDPWLTELADLVSKVNHWS